MFYSNVRPVTRKMFSYATNQFSALLYRKNERTDMSKLCLLLLMYLIENYAHFIALIPNSRECCALIHSYKSMMKYKLIKY